MAPRATAKELEILIGAESEAFPTRVCFKTCKYVCRCGQRHTMNIFYFTRVYTLAQAHATSEESQSEAYGIPHTFRTRVPLPSRDAA